MEMSGLVHNNVEDITILSSSYDNNNNKFNDKLNPPIDDYNDDVPKKISLCCEVCNIKVTSSKILQRHLDGRKHKMRSERKGKCYFCDLCDVTANSETQLNIHLSSSKHKARVLKKEYSEFTDVSANSKALWILIFCVLCIFLNLLLLFRIYL